MVSYSRPASLPASPPVEVDFCKCDFRCQPNCPHHIGGVAVGIPTSAPDPDRAVAPSEGKSWFEMGLPFRRRRLTAVGECAYCDAENKFGEGFHPHHDASQFCDSGKHPHCTCDTCF